MRIYRQVDGAKCGQPVREASARHAIVFGLNPGAAGEHSPGASHWLEKCTALTRGQCETFTLAELISQSTADTSGLKDPAGLMCVDAPANLALITEQRPQLIWQTGLSAAWTARSIYGLTPKGEPERRPTKKGCLLRPYERCRTPWIAIRHITGRWCGFNSDDMDAANAYGRRVLGARS